MGSRNVETQTLKRKKSELSRPVVSESREIQVPEVALNPSPSANWEREDNVETIYHCDFEVFGIVQGVSFRMYTLRKAQKLGIRGWCKNTRDDTLKGEIEGLFRPFDSMRLWLEYTGSPTSRIDKCLFSNIKKLKQFTYDDFSIRID